MTKVKMLDLKLRDHYQKNVLVVELKLILIKMKRKDYSILFDTNPDIRPGVQIQVRKENVNCISEFLTG